MGAGARRDTLDTGSLWEMCQGIFSKDGAKTSKRAKKGTQYDQFLERVELLVDQHIRSYWMGLAYTVRQANLHSGGICKRIRSHKIACRRLAAMAGWVDSARQWGMQTVVKHIMVWSLAAQLFISAHWAQYDMNQRAIRRVLDQSPVLRTYSVRVVRSFEEVVIALDFLAEADKCIDECLSVIGVNCVFVSNQPLMDRPNTPPVELQSQDRELKGIASADVQVNAPHSEQVQNWLDGNRTLQQQRSAEEIEAQREAQKQRVMVRKNRVDALNQAHNTPPVRPKFPPFCIPTSEETVLARQKMEVELRAAAAVVKAEAEVREKRVAELMRLCGSKGKPF
ncbi:hypothetical protein B0H17DRAFT_1124225 [Mycena rosella]|uniref:Uncharacterized protein n=1 Tax=Mycena rosella TaxID=1033263 RepID=A0AAD7MBS3_MYCRO|nr:hypothetical protein B0H17DRAFT_1124225 [Mycena rosella]